MASRRPFAFLVFVVLVARLNAFAQAAEPFELAGAGDEVVCGIGVPFFTRTVQFLGISVEEDTDIKFIAPAGDGRVLALTAAGAIVELRPDLTRTTIFAGVPGPFPQRFVVDAAGNMYLSTTQGRFFAIRPNGTIRAEFALDPEVMDLAADQCTLFYTEESGPAGIRRFNVCSGAPLPDFLPGVRTMEFKLLPDGGLLRLPEFLPEPEEAGRVFRYDAAGTLTRTYTVLVDGESLDLGRGVRSMFVSSDCFDDGVVREWDLDTGALLRSFSFAFNTPHSIVAYNGFTAALGTTADAHLAAVPSLSTAMLAVLGTLLMLIAIRRLV